MDMPHPKCEEIVYFNHGIASVARNISQIFMSWKFKETP